MSRRNQTDWRIRALYNCASTDQTRYHLNAVAIDETGDWLFSTDGHRLMVVRRKEVEHLIRGVQEANRAYDPNAFLRGGLITMGSDVKVVPWKQLVPTDRKPEWIFCVNFPGWLKWMKDSAPAGMRGTHRPLAFDNLGNLTTSQGIAAFNPGYLTDFAGMEDVYVHIRDALSPAIFTHVKHFDLAQADWFMVIMPMRQSGGMGHVVQQPKRKEETANAEARSS
jgi:hypothetical protein